MTDSDDDLLFLLTAALSMMGKGPKKLEPILLVAAETNDRKTSGPLRQVLSRLDAAGPNDGLKTRFALQLHEWDAEPEAGWTQGTPAHSEERRSLILGQLGLSAAQAARVSAVVPVFTPAELPVVIARTHENWYFDRSRPFTWFYWKHYIQQLLPPRGGWNSTSLGVLSKSTDDVLARLSDPTRSEVYQVKGLVVGYVQSGKTAHFSGLIAKAADCGYRLIIVLAGIMNTLREQTQRRIDKDIVGQELLAGSAYEQDRDWSSFVSHGGIPSAAGGVDIERLTDLTDDYSSLAKSLGALNLRRADPSLPFNHPVNLRSSPVRLVVIKKTPQRLNALTADLAQVRKRGMQVDQLPALIIDDESDQASINTIRPATASAAQALEKERQERTRTNLAIVELLRVLPRAQYVGYTATPFANVFVDPSDAENIFPKDFIVSLPKPAGYMGAAEFCERMPAQQGGKVAAQPAKENDFVWNIWTKSDDDPKTTELVTAMDCFVLSGAIKLFRQHADSSRFRFIHHTMLIHNAPWKNVHSRDADEVLTLFRENGYDSGAGIARLGRLLEKDFRPVWQKRNPDLPFPADMRSLRPFVGQCLARIIGDGDRAVRIVNGDNTDDAPDFDTESVWSILIGGAKLSRGYTVEGLTVTYFRRVATAADTLMQMGRWFGFRPGYRDLVRLFIGRQETLKAGSRKPVPIDLFAAFEALCSTEEEFRGQLAMYAGETGRHRLLPSQVPPLVMSHFPELPPTQKNKMYNAEIEYMNFSGRWKGKTLVSEDKDLVKANEKLAVRMLQMAELSLVNVRLKDGDGKALTPFRAYCAVLPRGAVVEFLRGYRWAGDRPAFRLELGFLEGTEGIRGIRDFLVMLPQLQSGEEKWSEAKGLPKMSVVERKRISESDRYGAFSTPDHVAAATYFAGTAQGLTAMEKGLESLKSTARAVLVLYRTRARDNPKAPVTLGFGVQFPVIGNAGRIGWRVKNAMQPDAVVVDVE